MDNKLQIQKKKKLKLAITSLINSSAVYHDHEQTLAPECLDQVIECLREVNSRHYSPRFADHLAVLLTTRFQGTGSIDDHEEAMALLTRSSLPNPSPIEILQYPS